MYKLSLISISGLVTLSYFVQLVFSGKIRIDLPGVELADYRFGLGDPYVAFYEREQFRGKIYFHVLGRNCTNLHESRRNWASSVDVQKRCIAVCDELDCQGHCAKIYSPDGSDPNNKGAPKLHAYGLNDKIQSVKFCYW